MITEGIRFLNFKKKINIKKNKTEFKFNFKWKESSYPVSF